MSGILPALSLPFYNVTCTANGEDVTNGLAFTMITTACALGCIGLRIIHSYSQRLIRLQNEAATLQGQLNTHKQEMDKEYLAKMVEVQTLRLQVMQKFEEVEALKQQVKNQVVALGGAAGEMTEQLRLAQGFTQYLRVASVIASQNERN